MGNTVKLTAEQDEIIGDVAREHAKNSVLAFGSGKLSYEELEEILKVSDRKLPEDVTVVGDYEHYDNDVLLMVLRELRSSYFWAAREAVQALARGSAKRQVGSTEWWVAQRSAQAHINAMYEMAKADGNQELEETYGKLRLSLVTY
jgi:hypothetical protein